MAARYSYNHRRFRTVRNSDGGEVSSETVFHYRQKGSVVWGTYRGGNIVFGTLLAQADPAGRLDMTYQHLNKNGELMTGRCKTRLEILDDGRYRLHERWQWTNGDLSSGKSIAEEVPRKRPTKEQKP